jgi:hypothetical protein
MAPKKIQEIDTDVTVLAPITSVEPVPLPEVYNDPYLSEEFGDPDAQFPRIQTLRGEGNQPPLLVHPRVST